MVQKKSKAFTLIELLVVIAIIGILAAMILVALNTARQRAKDARIRSDIHQLAVHASEYGLANNDGWVNWCVDGISGSHKTLIDDIDKQNGLNTMPRTNTVGAQGCYGVKDQWAISAKLNNGSTVGVDYKGVTKEGVDVNVAGTALIPANSLATPPTPLIPGTAAISEVAVGTGTVNVTVYSCSSWGCDTNTVNIVQIRTAANGGGDLIQSILVTGKTLVQWMAGVPVVMTGVSAGTYYIWAYENGNNDIYNGGTSSIYMTSGGAITKRVDISELF